MTIFRKIWPNIIAISPLKINKWGSESRLWRPSNILYSKFEKSYKLIIRNINDKFPSIGLEAPEIEFSALEILCMNSSYSVNFEVRSRDSFRILILWGQISWLDFDLEIWNRIQSPFLRVYGFLYLRTTSTTSSCSVSISTWHCQGGVWMNWPLNVEASWSCFPSEYWRSGYCIRYVCTSSLN